MALKYPLELQCKCGKVSVVATDHAHAVKLLAHIHAVCCDSVVHMADYEPEWKEHQHQWGRSVFIAALEVRHCEKDCPATEAKDPHGLWVRVDIRKEVSND